MSQDKDLEHLFAQARSAAPEPSADFLARVLSDAEAMQPAPAGIMRSQDRAKLGFRSLFSSLSEAIGGWPAMAGLASAAVTGIFIGISPPQGLIDPIGIAFGDTSILSESLEYGDGFDFTQYEG